MKPLNEQSRRRPTWEALAVVCLSDGDLWSIKLLDTRLTDEGHFPWPGDRFLYLMRLESATTKADYLAALHALACLMLQENYDVSEAECIQILPWHPDIAGDEIVGTRHESMVRKFIALTHDAVRLIHTHMTEKS